MQIPITDFERNNWSRIAYVAESVKKDRKTADVFRNAAQQQTVSTSHFDMLQTAFRAWLVFNEWNSL